MLSFLNTSNLYSLIRYRVTNVGNCMLCFPPNLYLTLWLNHFVIAQLLRDVAPGVLASSLMF